MQLSALPAVIPILQTKGKTENKAELWLKQSLKHLKIRVGEYLKRYPPEENCTI